MRTPTALDAMARWLVLTLAGVGLFALLPAGSFAVPGPTSARWLSSLHPVQVVALAMIVLAWALFVVHIAWLGAQWRRDAVSVGLAVLSVLAVAGVVAASTWGTQVATTSTFAIAVGLQVLLCVRIDALSRRPAGVPARRRRAAPHPA